ncbi:MAG: hypothetical protein HY730_02430 [Candidatus Tectomicrobia bacterium]|uniref:SWIM-type domain-containing protein n=1 Tax=Tectimicrobiota bacterium TaxID=2528274 RepID=A0A933LPM0_UNCTE|nr:hypothetical protein [Candidatus Tectomicrobia bacterium]
MSNIMFAIGDVNDKLSIAFAKAHGYRFTLHEDGNAEVINGDGKVYQVQDFECNCPDMQKNGGSYNGHCKHSIWIGQLLPCDVCNGMMGLGSFTNCFGQTAERFECYDCGNVRDFELVRVERRLRRSRKKEQVAD